MYIYNVSLGYIRTQKLLNLKYLKRSNVHVIDLELTIPFLSLQSQKNSVLKWQAQTKTIFLSSMFSVFCPWRFQESECNFLGEKAFSLYNRNEFQNSKIVEAKKCMIKTVYYFEFSQTYSDISTKTSETVQSSYLRW